MFMLSTAVTEPEAVTRLEKILDKLFEKLSALGSNLLTAALVAIIGWYIIKFIVKAFSKLLFRSKLDDSVASFLTSLTGMVLKILLIIIVITTLGIDVTSILALVGSAGLAIGLALQGCLSNFAGGVLILILKPFKVGDYILDGNGNEGTVTSIDIIYTHLLTADNSIDIIYTHLLTADNRAIVVPNGALSNATIMNNTEQEVRRIDFNVSVDYSENIDKVKRILLELAQNDEFVIKDDETRPYSAFVNKFDPSAISMTLRSENIDKVKRILLELAQNDEFVIKDDETRPYSAFVNKFDPSAISMTLRVWVTTADYWTAKAHIQEMIKMAFDKNDIVIPYDKLDVNITNNG